MLNNVNFSSIIAVYKEIYREHRGKGLIFCSHGRCHCTCFLINHAHNFELFLTFVCFDALKG